MRRSIPLLHILAIFVASLIVGLPHLGGALTPPMTYPLLQQSDLVYQGAFRLPNDGSVV